MLLRPPILLVRIQPRRGMPTITTESEYRLLVRRAREEHPFYAQPRTKGSTPRPLPFHLQDWKTKQAIITANIARISTAYTRIAWLLLLDLLAIMSNILPQYPEDNVLNIPIDELVRRAHNRMHELLQLTRPPLRRNYIIKESPIL